MMGGFQLIASPKNIWLNFIGKRNGNKNEFYMKSVEK